MIFMHLTKYCHSAKQFVNKINFNSTIMIDNTVTYLGRKMSLCQWRLLPLRQTTKMPFSCLHQTPPEFVEQLVAGAALLKMSLFIFLSRIQV